MGKSYVFMAKAAFMENAVVIPIGNLEAAVDFVSHATDYDTTEWAAAYEFQGDKLVTLDHYERKEVAA